MKINFILRGCLPGLLLLSAVAAQAQTLTGLVQEQPANAAATPLTGATLRWQQSNRGTVTDTQGRFVLEKKEHDHMLIVSFVGFKTDTFHVASLNPLTITLRPEGQLQQVTITGASTALDKLNPIQTEIITSRALMKAACCNLSETFETNASVSVSLSDAVTGAKQLQMLGLTGQYVQMNTENIPTIRGLNTTFGLNFTPGPWVTSIDVSKGVGSVINGYEAMAGAINVELAKPEAAERLYFNAYANSFGRGEMNLNLARKLSEKWSVGVLTHGSMLRSRLDANADGFLDTPLYYQLNALNRWKYAADRWQVQFGARALYEDRTGGQLQAGRGQPGVYTFGNTTRRTEAFSKIARLYPKKPYQGLALVLNAVSHQSDAAFGYKRYNGHENSLYANLIYQNIIQDTRHTYKLGVSYLLDAFREKFMDSTFTRTESVPGVFGEYTLALPEFVTLVAGGRADFHNLYGTRLVPRLHVLFHLPAEMHLRLSAGKGWRVPNAVAENFGMLVNSRTWQVLDPVLRPEESWNLGAGWSKHVDIDGREGSFSVDFYRTDFQNQLITDMESAQYIRVYNLRGRSFANSFQAELNLQPLPRTEVKLAYRWFDVRQSVRVQGHHTETLTLLPKMFVNRDRVLFNIGWASNRAEKYKLDFTWQWNGRRRIPNATAGHVHEATSRPQFAPAFSNFNAQVTRNFLKWAAYIGGENLGNFRQPNPILGASDPFGKSFDASMIWGPVQGRMLYGGVRYKLK